MSARAVPLALLVGVTSLAAPVAARAQGAPPGGAPPVPAATPEVPPESAEDLAMSESLADAEARANFEAGRVAFADARYDDALSYFERAHELSGRHQLLYNIGLCHDRLGRDVEALESFEQYLVAAPEAHNRAEVEQRIETARLRIERTAEEAAEDVAPPPPPPPPAADPAPWAITGVGGVLAVSGAVLLTVGRLDVAAIEAIPDGTRAWSAVAGDVERADALTVAGAIGLGVGAALAVTGIAWGVAGSSGSGEPSVAVRVGPGSFTLAGSF